MQRVNVVARWIDPVTGQASRNLVESSVSGFLFAGNDGNLIGGFADSSGQNFNRFGSDDVTLEGFFDLAGLPIPSGSSARYQITIEPLDPLWSENVGPYGSTSQVNPSGTFQPITVTLTLGSDVQQDIVMAGSAVQSRLWYGPTSYASPAPLPSNGNWAGVLNSYGAVDFFQFTAQANRTLSVIVNALDESGNLSESKLLPVIGIWALLNPGQSPAPANTSSAFNTSYFSETRLDAQILQSTTFRLGIADFRGDGRPDYRYNARVLYGDGVLPVRASVAGDTVLTIQGLGLQSDTQVETAGHPVPVLSSSATRLLVNTPPLLDGVYDFLLSDVNTGGSSNHDWSSDRGRWAERPTEIGIGLESCHAGGRTGSFTIHRTGCRSRRRHSCRRCQRSVCGIADCGIFSVRRWNQLHRAERREWPCLNLRDPTVNRSNDGHCKTCAGNLSEPAAVGDYVIWNFVAARPVIVHATGVDCSGSDAEFAVNGTTALEWSTGGWVRGELPDHARNSQLECGICAD
jgi:hypothetical protein